MVRALSEADALGVVIWGEARAETPDGQIAVGQVILARLRTGRWGHTVPEVVTARAQFSCLWPWGGGENHARVRELALALHDGVRVDSASWRQCRWIAAGLLAGNVTRDLVHDATHYLTTALLKSGKAPVWALTMGVTAIVGHHTFGIPR